MSFAPIKKQTVASKIAESIRGAIVDGKLAPGEALPSERDLASQFDVNRSSIREALLRLEAWGLVKIRQGGATRVIDIFKSGGLQLLPYLLMPGGKLDVGLARDILQMRVMFLRWTAEQAALAEDKDLDAISKTVEDLKQAQTSAEAQKLDWQFFEQLVALTQNRVLAFFTRFLRDLYLKKPEPMGQLLYGSLPFDTTHHRATIDAMRDGDSERAGLAMQTYARSVLGR